MIIGFNVMVVFAFPAQIVLCSDPSHHCTSKVSVVEWLKHRTDNQPLNYAILLGPWERHFTALSPAWWSWQAVLNYRNSSTKLQADSNIVASPEAGRGNCLPYV